MTHRVPRPTHPLRQARLLPADDHLGWTPYLWLVFLSIFLVEPCIRIYLGAAGTGYTAATVAGLAVFLASYFRGFWTTGRELLLIVALQALLGAAFAPVNAGASVFFVYAASFAGNLGRSRTAAPVIVLIATVGLFTSWLTRAPLPYWVPAAGLPLLVGFVNLHQAQVRRANARLALAQEQIEQLAAVAERERIARDLHDLLGHTLSLIVLKSELAAKLATRDPERATREIRDVEQVSRKALREVREAVRGYRPSLAEEIQQSRSLLVAAGIHAEISAPSLELERTVEEVLALALREAVTNVVRHSGAEACRVRLHAEADHCLLVVEDDGGAGGAPEGGGLRGMRERVEALGGRVSRDRDRRGGGLRLSVYVPIALPPGRTLRRVPAAMNG